MDKVIGIGEYAISNNPKHVLKTFALASCVAVTFYCPIKKVAGMIHIALPSHHEAGEKTKKAYYATLGIPLIIEELKSKYGCLISEVFAQLFGGANSIREDDCFNIGAKNIQAVQCILNELNIKVTKSNVGGFQSRSITMEVSSGNISILTHPIKI